MDDKSIMKFEKVLPENFTGIFSFTNWTDDDFVGKWAGKEYHFPAQSTSPMVIPDHSPIEIQHIRKKFAKDLAEIQFYKSDKYNKFISQERNPDGSPRASGIHQAATYTIDDLTPFIKRCLEDLPVTRATVILADKVKIEDKLTRNDKGKLNTMAVEDGESLQEKFKQ